MTSSEKVILGLLAAGAALFVVGGLTRKKEPQDWYIDPDLGKHRGLAYIANGPDQAATRLPSRQDPRGGAADYLGYNYGATQPSAYAWGEPAQKVGKAWDKREDQWAYVDRAPLDYGQPPLRIPRPWKDANRFWDGITSWGGTEVVAQRLHLFHLRPSAPTKGYRSVSGMLAPVGGGQSTASRVRIPAIFVPSSVA